MSRLNALALVATLLLAPSVARATEEAQRSTPPERRAEWTLGARVGYVAAWSTGVSHLGIGEGLAFGRTWRWGLHLELQGFHFEGDRDVAGNATLTYVSSYHSLAAQAGAGYEFALGHLRLRPGALAGVSFVDGVTKLGRAIVKDEITRGTFGPSFTCFVVLSRFHLGAEAQALFVPSDVAAPSLGVFGLFGAAL